MLKTQFRRTAALDLAADGFDLVIDVDSGSRSRRRRRSRPPVGGGDARATAPPTAESRGGPAVRAADLRIPVGHGPAGWLGEVAQTAEQAGFAAIAVMDHLLQIPQVGRVWDPIPEAYVTLGYLAGSPSGSSSARWSPR